jgi:N-acetylglucosamine kinase-like BadF-type ATPase
MDENGVVLGWGVGGPVNYRPMEDILQSFDDALAGALHSFTAGELWVGLICGGGHVARRLAERGIEAHLHGVGEIEGGYLAALQPWGIMALSGTGSFIHGRRPDGRELHLGGLGPILGDEGSAYDLGLRSCRAALRSHWSLSSGTVLADTVVRALGAGSVWSIVDLFHGHHLTRGVMARLAPLVDEAARAGDEVACDIMSRSAIGLAEILAVVLEELSLAGQSYPVFGLGGVAQGSPFFWDLFAAEALRRDPTLQLTVPPVRLAVGAAFGAMVQAGVEVNASLRDTVVASQDAFPPSLVRTKMTLI